MIVALNNKCNLNYSEWIEYVEKLGALQTKSTMILCPSFINLRMIPENVKIGAQNVSCFGKGAYTGEVSAEQLKSYGVEYTIVGHSERRGYQKETDKEVYEKVNHLLEEGITPILCVGETLEERQNNQVEEVLLRELSLFQEEQKEKMIIAYEPIWSIGTGVIPTNEEIEAVFKYIKNLFPDTPVLYGGSANEENIDQLKQISLIDGYLLGGLSLKPDKLDIFLKKCDE